jgi:hypothetical protein
MRMIGPGKRLRICIGESDCWQGKPLYMALLETLKQVVLSPSVKLAHAFGFGSTDVSMRGVGFAGGVGRGSSIASHWLIVALQQQRQPLGQRSSF